MSEEYINVKNILSNSILNNKAIIFITIPLLLGYYLQDVVFTRSIAEVTRDIPNFVKEVNMKKILKVLAPFIFAIIVFYITNIIYAKSMASVETETLYNLTSQVIESAKTTKKKLNVNEVMSQIKKIGEAKNVHKIFASYLIPTAVIVFSLLYNFFIADTQTGLTVSIIIISLILVTLLLEYNSIHSAYKAEISNTDLYDGVHEIVTNMDTVITSDTKEKELKNIDILKNKTYEHMYNCEVKNGNTTYALQLASLGVAFIINYLSYTLYMNNSISSVTLVSIVLLTLLFMDYYNYCVVAIKDVTSSIGKLYDAQSYFSNFKIMKHSQSPQKQDLLVTNGNVKFENITLKYDNKIVLNNITININGNSNSCIIGPIGSGKSTLLKILAGVLEYEGNVIIDGQNLKNLTYESITNNIAYVSQHPKLFNKSILYNIGYGTNYTESEIIGKLNQLGLMEFINEFPKKLQTIVGKEGTSVSGGQRQFISFIRALIQNKSIILLDEPSSSLDSGSKKVFTNLLKNINDKTIIIVTHDKDLFPVCDQIINMNNLKNQKETQHYEDLPFFNF